MDVDGATVRIDGTSYPLKNWSSGGFLALSYSGDHEVGDAVEIVFKVPFVGLYREFTGSANVVRVIENEGEIAGLLITMDDQWSNDALKRYFRMDWTD